MTCCGQNQLDPFHKNREITRKVKDEKQRETVRKLLAEKRIKDLLTYINQKVSWSKAGAENLGCLLCKKVCRNLYDAITVLSRTVLPERYTRKGSEEMEYINRK